ncbi:MAG: penicillinase repressor [Citrobacter freundii]|nr:MAG: penicillinase repressor [Citrobacter freundii]
MIKLAKAEEQLMELIWQQGKVFLKDLIEAHPDPKPAATTVATLLKRMQDKGFVGYDVFGNSRQYFPIIKKEDYFSRHIREMVKDYFGDSALQFASFFTTNTDLTADELEDLKRIINQEIKKKKK